MTITPLIYPLVANQVMITAFMIAPISHVMSYSPHSFITSFHASAWHKIIVCHYRWLRYSPAVNIIIATFIHAGTLIVCARPH